MTKNKSSTLKQTTIVKNDSFISKIKADYWPVIVLLFLAFVIYGAFVFSDQMLFGSDTFSGIDARTLYVKEIKNGNFPLWFPTRLSGMPTVDALFGDAFYPVNILTLVLPLHRALGWKIVLHVFLAGLFFYLLLYRGFSIDKKISMLGAMLYMLNTEFISHTYPGHDGKMFVISLLPLVMWMLERLINKTTLWRSALFGLSIGLCVLTSHIQMTYFVLWGLFAYIVFRLIFIIREEKDSKKSAKLFGFFWIGVFLGLGIGMIQLLPPYMYVRDGMSVRGPQKGFEYAASWSMHPEETASLIVPDFGNTLDSYWGKNYFKLNSEYAGLIASLLFVFSVIIIFDKISIFWLGTALFSLMYALGEHTPVLKICYYLVPGVKSFRGPSMIMFWFSFALIFAGIRGLSKFVSESLSWPSNKKQIFWKRVLIACASIGILCLILTAGKDAVISSWNGIFYQDITDQKLQIMKENYSNFTKGLWLFGLFSVVSLLSLGSYMNGKLKQNTLIGIIFAAGLIDLWRVNSQFIKTVDSAQYLSPDYTLLSMEKDPEPKRIFDLPGAYNNNFVGIFGFESVAGFHDNELKWYRDFRGENSSNLTYILNANDLYKNPFLNLLNTKYLLYKQSRDKPVQVILNKGYLPRAFLLDKYEIMPDSFMVSKLKDTTFDYRNICLLDKKPSIAIEYSDSIPAGNANYTRETSDNFKVNVNANKNCMLVISEIYYPGWTVAIDNKPAEILKAYSTLMAVEVTKGNHIIEFKMHSKYLNIGALISVVSLLFFVIIGFFYYKTKRHLPK